jgi:Coenzyme PQQ synthesis protein D (PqqD).
LISTESRPRLASKARLRFDRKSSRYMLLYPERGLVLNPTAADVLQRCDGRAPWAPSWRSWRSSTATKSPPWSARS